MANIDFYYFTFSTYLLMIGLAFVVSFMLFYYISKDTYDKIDLLYVFVMNIFGFGIGAKLLSFAESGKSLSFASFIKSGYAFLGGILGSILFIFLYCKKYKLGFDAVMSKFVVVYPVIYSISKVGCLFSGCCVGELFEIPIQIIDCIVMFFLTIYLLKSNNDKVINRFFIFFGIFRFVEDFFRISRNLLIGFFTLDQVVCIIFVFWGRVFLDE